MILTKARLKVVAPILAGALGIGVGGTAVFANQHSNGPQSEFHQREMTAGAKTFKRVQTSNAPTTTSSTTGITLTVASVPVAAGRTALINVKWAGETSCAGGGAEGNWCWMRVTVGGVEAHPQAGTEFAIDSTDGGTARSDDWEGHLIERHRCVRNGSTSTVNIPVTVLMGVTNRGGGTAPTFRADDWALDIQRADNCSPLN
jgi:hypothetical protein